MPLAKEKLYYVKTGFVSTFCDTDTDRIIYL